jgi:hypothetical protein
VPNATDVRRQTAQARVAYEAPPAGVRLPWRLLTAGLFVTALASLLVRSVCHPEVPGASETGFGVRHEQHGRGWYHCEPWIRRVLGG